MAVPYHFPVDGEYLVKIELRSNWQDYILGMGSEHLLDVRIDGELVKRFTVGGEDRGRPAPVTFTIAERGDPEWEAYLQTADEDLEVRVPVEAGPRTVGVSFVRNVWEPEGILLPRQAGEVLSNDEAYHGNAAVSAVAIGGPYSVAGPGGHPEPARHLHVPPGRRGPPPPPDPAPSGPRPDAAARADAREPSASARPSRRRAPRPDPAADAGERACATEIVSRLARRAYRRPVTAADVDTLLGFFDSGREGGGSFDAGVQLALERMLVDPDFLLRIERDPAGGRPRRAVPARRRRDRLAAVLLPLGRHPRRRRCSTWPSGAA